VMCGGRYCCFVAVATAWAAFEKTNLARAASDHHPLPRHLIKCTAAYCDENNLFNFEQYQSPGIFQDTL